MVRICLNNNDYGIILIRKICNQNQPTLKHLKERINAITDIRLKNHPSTNLLGFRKSGTLLQTLETAFHLLFDRVRQEASSYYISAEADNKPISIPRNKRMLLYFCVSQLLDDGVFEDYTIKKMVSFLQTNLFLTLKIHTSTTVCINSRKTKS